MRFCVRQRSQSLKLIPALKIKEPPNVPSRRQRPTTASSGPGCRRAAGDKEFFVDEGVGLSIVMVRGHGEPPRSYISH